MYYKVPRIVVGDKDRVEPLSRMRAAIAENMANARRSTAHCHTVWEADVTHVLQLRKKLKAEYEGRGVNLTLTAFFVQALARALSAFPAMNAAFDGENFVYRGNINIGIASALEDGLIVPVLKNVDGLNLFGVARGVGDLAARSKSKNLVPADVADGTFTLTNSGVFGSLYGIPILVTPQVGILNLGGINKRVVADDDDNIRIRSIMTICLTFDHRVIDGSTADGFCGAFVKELANFKAS
jgi:pyruvate dehydrogenase E2 component (dihydrolipoamide acetyltransferase)